MTLLSEKGGRNYRFLKEFHREESSPVWELCCSYTFEHKVVLMFEKQYINEILLYRNRCQQKLSE